MHLKPVRFWRLLTRKDVVVGPGHFSDQIQWHMEVLVSRHWLSRLMHIAPNVPMDVSDAHRVVLPATC